MPLPESGGFAALGGVDEVLPSAKSARQPLLTQIPRASKPQVSSYQQPARESCRCSTTPARVSAAQRTVSRELDSQRTVFSLLAAKL
jgi:hypothetical protein